MNHATDPRENLSPLKRAILAIDDLTAKLDAATRAQREPVAIVGAGCRLPGGVAGPEELWRLLRDGGYAGVEVPRDRWDADAWFDPDANAPGKTTQRTGGFLSSIDRFDAAFFGIAPREAASMDPQQRLLLEVAWEALEHAGIAPEGLEGSDAGVFVGLYNDNYTMLGRGSGDPSRIDAWSASGSHTSVASGRISYTLGLRGPSVSVDTACSSSLTAVHLAVQSLRSGECRLALAGGVHLLLSPLGMVASTKLGVTAADGRCKAFDAAADGFGHGEGCAIVVLKRLSDAQADGDRILAVIRGSAVNQDGKSSSLTAPNGPAQEAVIKKALEDARVSPYEVGYVEAHGTGTQLGDPIEAGALVEALVTGRRPDQPLFVGSVKTNLGHLEAAAGVAGLLKLVLSLEHREIPPHLHWKRLSPHIPFDGLPVVIPTERLPWPAQSGRRIGGVSSFGFSGTNAHVVVEEAPEPAPVEAASAAERPAHLLCLSAKDEAALRELAERYEAHLGSTAEALSDICFTAAQGRAHFPHRIAVTAADAAEAASKLRALRAGEDAPGLARGRAGLKAPKVGFLFTGQGAQHAGMGLALYESEPVFRAVIDRCEAALAGKLSAPLRAVLFEGAGDINATANAQPALFALEVALAELWRSWGIEPVAMLGHSVGEYAAACVAGVFGIEEGIRLVAERGRRMQGLSAAGAMAAVHADEARVRGALVGEPEVGIAAVNGPANTVISGDEQAVTRVLERFKGEGVNGQRLLVSHAFHSALLEPMLEGFEEAARGVVYAAPKLPVISNLTGQLQGAFDAAYWKQHARNPVQFAAGMRELVAQGCEVFVEVGPHPVLSALGSAVQERAPFIASLRRGAEAWRTLLEGLGRLYTLGAAVDWAGLGRGRQKRRKVALPTYPFQRQRYWLDEPMVPSTRTPPESRRANAEVGERTVYDFYNALSVVAKNYELEADRHEEGHLTFGLFPEVIPGFSWVKALFDGKARADDYRLLVSSQRALKDALFEGIDFSEARRVMDFGCGHAADICSLGVKHPHLRLDGYTISAGQVAVGTRRIEALGLTGRVRAHHRDSARDPFPGRYDVIFGFEVSGLIADKEALFSNIGGHLENGGLLVIADFVATEASIASPDTASFTSTEEEWGDLLSRQKLRLVRCVDASVEIANFIEDPEFEAHVDDLVRREDLPELTRRHLLSNDNIRKALRLGVMRYVLLTAQKDPLHRAADLRAWNIARLAKPTPLAEVAHASGAEVWRTWLYGIEWRPRPLTASPSPTTPAIGDIQGPLEDAAARMRAELSVHRAAGEQVDALSVDYILQALRKLGCDSVASARGVELDPRYRRLQDRLVEVLIEAGVEALPDPGDVDARCAAFIAAHPALAGEVGMLRRCGAELAEVLTGVTDPLQVLFPRGDTAAAEDIYERSPFARAVNALCADAAVALIGRLDPARTSRPRRILEIGGGTGGTTARVLERLPREGVEYVFTDVSAAFLGRAERKFARHRFMSFRMLDISADPEPQGFRAHDFDVVIAANVLHATPTLRQTLLHVQRLLSPGGALVLIENTGRLRWGDLTFGLTPGMWSYTDVDLRPSYALLWQREWLNLLSAAGFESPTALTPGEPDRGGISQQTVLLAQAPRATAARRFQIVADRGSVADELAKQLRAQGDICSVTEAGSALQEGQRVDGVFYLAGLDAEAPTDLRAALEPVLSLVQRLTASLEAPRLWIVTRGAEGPGATLRPEQAPLWGFGRVATVEHPELSCTLVDLDPAAPIGEQAAALCEETRAGDGEGMVAWSAGLRFGARLVPEDIGATTKLRVRGDATYLITGAFGGLGPEVAAWLAKQGARHLVLMGRRAPDARVEAMIERLLRMDVAVEVVKADVSNEADVAHMIGEIRDRMPTLRGVIHAAGVLDDGVIQEQRWSRFETVLGPKVAGAWNLHLHTWDLPLDFFVLFSSAAALLGSAGQSNHAAANAFLDALARARKAQGLPALSVNWGAWAEVGAAARGGIEAGVERRGLVTMAPSQALEALGHVMASGVDHAGIFAVDWTLFLKRYPEGAVPPYWTSLRLATRAVEPVAAPANDSLARIKRAPVERRRAVLIEVVCAHAARIMGLPAVAPHEPRRPLRDLGLDSLMAVEMRNALASMAGTKLPATLLFECPTCEALADFLARGALSALFPER